MNEKKNLEKVHKKDKIDIIKRQSIEQDIKVLIRQETNKFLKEYKNNLNPFLEKRKQDLANKIMLLAQKEISSSIPIEPIIMKMIKKPFARTMSEPIYDTWELKLVFDYYQDMVEEIILNGIPFIPSRQNFSAFAGISSASFDYAYLKSNDLEKQKVAQSIEDYFIETNWSGAKRNKLNSYAVEKYNKLQGVGGGYIEPKVAIGINQSSILVGNADELKSKLLDIKEKFSLQ